MMRYTLISYIHLKCKRGFFIFHALRVILGATIVLLCVCALLLSHILPVNLFFFLLFITAVESLQLRRLECVCGVHYFRLE